VVPLRERFDLLFEHSVDGAFFMTLDEPFAWHPGADKEALLDYAFDHLRLSAVNRVLCEQLGSTRDELIGTVPRQRWTVDIDVWRTRMRELYDQGRTYFTMRAPRRDGRWFDVEGQYICTYDDDGRITGCFGTQRDVTELQRTADRLQLATESADIGIWDYDLDTNGFIFDDRFIARMGYSSDDPAVRTGVFWTSLIHPSDLPEVERSYDAHIRGHAPSYRVELRMRAANGEWRWFLSSGRVTAHDDSGRPLRMVGLALDITERKLLQERLFFAERLASLGTLAAGVGHEINNPLTYIALNLTLIDRELRTLELPASSRMRLQHMLEQARYGTERVSGIVRDLQALTRVPDEGLENLDPPAVLERCLEIADHQIRHRARVIRELAAVPPVRGSEGRMVQLFLNLLVNAAQAIDKGTFETSWIKVATSVDAGRVVVTIADNGVGIAPEAIGRIFDPFYTTKQVGEGTGLGLSICRSIVTALGGEISVDSVSGQGTTVRVALPAAQGEARVPVPAPAPARESAPRIMVKKRVLVIDDEPMVGQLVVKVLADHDVIAETSGRAALERLAADGRFDLILCDLMMPDVSGMDFYDRCVPALRGRIVFLSGGVYTERAQQFLARVPNRHLAKPFDVDTLTSVLLSVGDHDALP
jgi:PAS domain S-box-containing protein